MRVGVGVIDGAGGSYVGEGVQTRLGDNDQDLHLPKAGPDHLHPHSLWGYHSNQMSLLGTERQ